MGKETPNNSSSEDSMNLEASEGDGLVQKEGEELDLQHQGATGIRRIIPKGMRLLPSVLLLGSVFVVLVSVRAVLLPFLLAIFLAYLIYPLVRMLTRLRFGSWHIPRWLGVILVYLVILGGGIPLVVDGVGILKSQIANMGTSIPQLVGRIESSYESFYEGIDSRYFEVKSLPPKVQIQTSDAIRSMWVNALEAKREAEDESGDGTPPENPEDKSDANDDAENHDSESEDSIDDAQLSDQSGDQSSDSGSLSSTEDTENENSVGESGESGEVSSEVKGANNEAIENPDANLPEWCLEAPEELVRFRALLFDYLFASVEADDTYLRFVSPSMGQQETDKMQKETRVQTVLEMISIVKREVGGFVGSEIETVFNEEFAAIIDERFPAKDKVLIEEAHPANIPDTVERLYRKSGLSKIAMQTGIDEQAVESFALALQADIVSPEFAREGFGLEFRKFVAGYQERLEGALENVVSLLQRFIAGVIGGIFKAFLVMMLAAFFIVFFGSIRAYVRKIIPWNFRDDYENLLDRVDDRLSGVIRGQLIICVINGLLTYLGLVLIGVNYAGLLSILAGVMSLIPIFGTIMSTVPSALVALAGDGGPADAIAVIGWVCIIHAIEAYLLNPNIMGHSAHLNPIVVVFLLLVGEHFGGFIGALLAVPIGSVFVTFFIFAHRKASGALEGKEVLEADTG